MNKLINTLKLLQIGAQTRFAQRSPNKVHLSIDRILDILLVRLLLWRLRIRAFQYGLRKRTEVREEENLIPISIEI